MKKLIKSLALVLAAILVFGLTVSAAPSPSGVNATDLDRKIAGQVQKIANNGGFGVNGQIGNLSAKWLKWAQDYATAKNLGEVKTIFFFDSNETNKNFSCRFDEVEKGKEYVFLHYTGANAKSGNWEDVTEKEYDPNAWEVIKVTVTDDYILTGYFNSFSPIGIAEAGSGASVVAPKTGEIIALAAIMALIMIAGAVVCAKKARLQK